MRPKKKLLSLNREIVRQLTAHELSDIRAGIIVRTGTCPTALCPTVGCPTWRHSCFDSCYDSDCCLEVP
jgi:hypothetical protein